MRIAQKDLLLGAIYTGFGVVYGVTALRELPIGAPLNMGPGFFPLVLSGGLVAIGVAVVLKGLVEPAADGAVGKLAWRGLVSISVATLVFAFTVQGAGMVISTILTTLIAGAASRRARPLPVIATALILAAFCSGVFVYGLRLPIGLLGSWFD